MDREDAERALRGPHSYTHLVSCRSSDAKRLPYHAVPIEGFHSVPYRIQFKFDDCNDSGEAELGYKLPTRRDVDRLIHWARSSVEPENESQYLFHCSAGISRSTACALITLIALGLEPQHALVMMFNARPIASPNRLLIRHADRALGLAGRLIELVDGIMDSRHGCATY